MALEMRKESNDCLGKVLGSKMNDFVLVSHCASVFKEFGLMT